MKTQDHAKKGFTLIEMILVVGISSLVLGTIVSSVLYFYRTNAHAVEQVYAIEGARKGIEYLVRDLREATYADDGSYPFIAISDSEVFFYSDVDRDDSVERIRYRLVSGVLEKGVTKAHGNPATYSDVDELFSVISTSVRNEENNVPIFSYFDAGGTAIADFNNVTDVVFISVNLIININPARLPEDFTLRSSATIRNLKTNL
ncbi:MAG TPA: prepilin-type N-terminal cleavage/methylation domain-containing protein [Candidatus Paceibacterota bacterium]